LDILESVPERLKLDSKRFKQVVFNLIGNAIKFTPKGHIAVKVWHNDSTLYTSISDTGIGIKEEDK